MATQTQTLTTKMVTGKVRFSYLHVWEASSINNSPDKKFSASLIIPKTDKTTLSKIKACVDAAKELGKSSKWGGKLPVANFKMPLRDGDVERPEDPAYAGCYFVNANAKEQPGIVDKTGSPILDKSRVYSGCYGHASITFFPFDSNGSKGVACGLNHIMKSEDGEPLGGRDSAENDFAEVLTAGGSDDDFMS